MSTTLYLYAMSDFVSLADLKVLYHNQVGHKWYDMSITEAGLSLDSFSQVIHKIDCCPSFWIGRSSKVRAAKSDRPFEFVPHFVSHIESIVDDGVTIVDHDFIYSVKMALRIRTNSSHYKSIAEEKYGGQELLEFLQSQKVFGRKVFLVHWQ